jgi:hypothetical protein
LASLSGDAKTETQAAVRDFMTGTHVWQADHSARTLQIDQVIPAPQPVGALFDFLLDSDGKMSADRRKLFSGEIGVLGIGMNTTDLLAVDGGQTVERFTAASQLGVRRLLELTNLDGLYTIAEMDAKLRTGKLDTTKAMPLWADEVKGFIDREWGAAWQRFSAVVCVGGGAVLLRDILARKFGPRAQFADDAVLSTARGLYKFSLMKKYAYPLAFDAGFGSIKVYGSAGSIVMPSAVATDGRGALGDLAGLKSAARPLHVSFDGGQFYVGHGAHRFGRPVQSLDLDRVVGSPEIRALFLGAMTKYHAIAA